MTAKQGVCNKLAHRAKIVSHNQEELNKELEHIRRYSRPVNSPLGFKTIATQIQRKQNQDSNHNHNLQSTDNINSNNHKNITIVLPYIQDIGERFKKACHSRDTQVHFKGTHTLKTILVKPKDKDNKLQKIGVIYHFKCPHNKCLHWRIWEVIWKQNKRTPEGFIFYPPTQQYNRTPHMARLL